MTIGTSLFLIAVGAILMLVGGFGLLLGIFLLTRGNHSTDGPVVRPV